MDRRKSVKSLSISATGVFLLNNLSAIAQKPLITNSPKIKPFTASWIEFQHNTPEGAKCWNKTLQTFTANDWREKLKK